MNIQIEHKIGALFKLVVRKTATNKITNETGWFHNIVLNTGLDQMSVGTWIGRCCVGTGNSTPTVTQTALDNFLASTVTTSANVGGVQATSPSYWWYRRTWRFNEGVATGNLSELGLGWGDTNLWNRALIKDINGNPTTITVLSDEYLDVVSEIRVYPTESFSGAFNLLDKTGALISSHTYIGKPSLLGTAGFNATRVTLAQHSEGVKFYSGAIGATATQDPASALVNGTVANPTNTYPTSRSVRIVPSLGLTAANGTHRSIRVYAQSMMIGGSNIGYQIEISPTITKTSSQIMTYTFELTWDRYTP